MSMYAFISKAGRVLGKSDLWFGENISEDIRKGRKGERGGGLCFI